MPKGDSGRVVVEVDPDLKRRLYTALASDNSTLKEWFIEAAEVYVSEKQQPALPGMNKTNKKDKRS